MTRDIPIGAGAPLPDGLDGWVPTPGDPLPPGGVEPIPWPPEPPVVGPPEEPLDFCDWVRETCRTMVVGGFARIQPLPEQENALSAEAMDLRFGSPLNPGFVASAVLNGRLEVVRSRFTFGAVRPR